ncbi:hypothetical protein [Pyruvatibacter mobilis]|uniref:Abi-alpha family protein n=1 Tax=Pyruvatibacter mobilis TaxID=1712261 RepID=UPI003BA92872
MKERIEGSIGSDSASFSIEGDSGEGLLKRAADLISPFSETFGLLGDKIRIYRETSLLRSIKKARQLADAEGLELQEPPQKFLIHWAEHASMEDGGELDVAERWANLLVSAATDFRPGHLLFIRILGEITSVEAQLIERIAHADGKRQVGHGVLQDALTRWKQFDSPASPIADVDISYQSREFIDWAMEQFRLPGVAVETISVWTGYSEPFAEPYTSTLDQTVLDYDDYVTLELLIALNIVTKSECVLQPRDYLRIRGVAYCLTPMGADFYAACARDRVVMAPSSIPDKNC